MNVAAVFGPGPLEARQIDEITRTEAVLIIDNGHNPGFEGTRTLLDIFEMNRVALEDALD